jgi:hypothetical protein
MVLDTGGDAKFCADKGGAEFFGGVGMRTEPA